MEITQAEYMDLQNKIAELQAQVSDMAKKPRNTFAGRISEKPIYFIAAENSCGKEMVYFRSSTSSDAWLLLSKLAKLIHVSDGYFVADRTGYNTGYLRPRGERKAPKKVEELTEEQLALSVNMLDEMIAIYNKYFKAIHTGAYINNLFDEPNKYRFVRVSDECGRVNF